MELPETVYSFKVRKLTNLSLSLSFFRGILILTFLRVVDRNKFTLSA